MTKSFSIAGSSSFSRTCWSALSSSASRYFWSIAFAFAVLLSVLLSSLLRNEMYFEPITPRYAPKKARTVVVAVVR
jgi:hypothetical protein